MPFAFFGVRYIIEVWDQGHFELIVQLRGFGEAIFDDFKTSKNFSMCTSMQFGSKDAITQIWKCVVFFRICGL